jgi:predicted GNAT family acetyltransferase
MSAPTVGHVPDRARYEIAVDDQRAGLSLYLEDDGRRIFFHTEVDDAYEGQGLAAILVAHALDDTRAAGLRVVATCPYVTQFVRQHPEYADLVDPVTPQAIEKVRAAV